ncbi:MAG TPA: hypothetical protein QGF35_04295 [Dehalococcoidia bacterium]|nr:hypothetical protein [Dehalococcoidia bacterium]
MANDTGSRPDHIRTMNSISLAETDAGRYLSAWADVTTDEGLRASLRIIAARETSHGDVLERRLNELGYDLEPRPKPEWEERFKKYSSAEVSDLEKVGPAGSIPDGDLFGDLEKNVNEGDYDPLSELLMRWYIAEERDSADIARAAYARVREKGAG